MISHKNLLSDNAGICLQKKSSCITQELPSCGRRDLNPHERNAHKNLNLARLPIPTLPQTVWIYFTELILLCMRKMGLEPTRPNGHKILSLARLPIPTLPQTVVFLTTQRYVFYHRYSHKSTVFLNFFNFFLTHEKSSWNCRSQCGRRDLNPHERSAHKNLNLARLPIPTLPHHVWYNTSSWQKCQIFLKCFSKNTFCRF